MGSECSGAKLRRPRGNPRRRPGPERPDELCGADASRLGTQGEGWCSWFFAARRRLAPRPSSAGALRRRAAARRRWSRSTRASEPTWAASTGPSLWTSVCGTAGGRSIGQSSSKPRSNGSASAPRPATLASRSAAASRSGLMLSHHLSKAMLLSSKVNQ